MTQEQCISCGTFVHFYAIDLEDPHKMKWCWPCWVNLDKEKAGEEE